MGRWGLCTNIEIASFMIMVLFSLHFLEVYANALADHVHSSLQNISTKVKPRMKLDLMGLISTLGTRSATRSLVFSSLNDAFSVTGHIGPGSLSIATALLQMTGFRVAQLLSPGGEESNTGGETALSMKCPQGLHYIGLNSGTQCPILNTVGASIVREHKQLWNNKHGCGGFSDYKLVGRDAGRRLQVLVLSTGNIPATNAQVLLKGRALDCLFLGWMPLLLSLGVISVAFASEEWFIGALIGLGTLGMTLSVVVLRCSFTYRYAEPKVAEGAPKGDCVIVDDMDTETLHIVMGTESFIQSLFQRKLQQEQNRMGRLGLLFAGLMLYTYSIASVLWLPNVSIYSQIFFTAANALGLVTDVIKGSKNGNLGLARKAQQQFELALSERVVFGNRTAAVAFVAKHAEECSVLKSLLPMQGPVWEKWWEVLHRYKQNMSFEDLLEDVFCSIDDYTLFQKLVEDMKCGLNYHAGFH